MRHYPEEHKKAVVSKLIESGLSLRQFAQREGISLSTLYGWRDKYTEADFSLTKSNTPENWTAEQKFSAVIETAAGKRAFSRSKSSNGNIAVSPVINPRRISVNSRPRNVKRIRNALKSWKES